MIDVVRETIRWTHAMQACAEFASSIGVTGALVAMCVIPVRSGDMHAPALAYAHTARRCAAWIGAAAAVGQLLTYEWQGRFTSGAWWTITSLWRSAPSSIEMRVGWETAIRVVALALAVVGFATAALADRAARAPHARFGWVLAWTAGIYGPVATMAESTKRVALLLHPVHLLAAGAWVGTLAVLLPAVLRAVGRSSDSARREFAAAVLERFSPIALASASVLLLTGAFSAAPRLSASMDRWPRTYVCVLALKLITVGAIVACGAWNWRRMRPALRQEGGGVSPRIAILEVLAALAAIALASVLVSIERLA